MRRIENKKEYSFRGQRFVWAPAPTRLFLKLWLENIDGLRGARVNTHIHREMAEKMQKYGPTHVEVKAKLDNMTKKYRIEMTKYRNSGQPSKWEYFSQVQEILKESKLVNLSLCMADSFDYSPMEDSDSSDSADSNFNAFSPPATANSETELPRSPEKAVSIKSDSAYSANTYAPPQSNYTFNKSERILKIEEAKLAIQKEKLKLMKNIADNLSSIHRNFLKAYKMK
ncbi:uncharacterized protein LOC135427799 isoform X1 [Drosophila montana]|uniref:uncharacterized protein LOC135427799 isoform X1 n=2 Tax=Drosophila montana TaxID=40370 RepID=UPI00313B738E